MKQVILLIGGRPGSGKSQFLTKQMVVERCKYVLFCPRIDLITERADDLRAWAQKLGLREPVIEIVHSQTGAWGSVGRQLAEAFKRHAGADHVVIISTHQALIEADLTECYGWHARIDEVPNGVKAASWRVPASVLILRAAYDLIDAGDGWRRIEPKSDCPSLKAWMQDDLLKGMADFHKLVISPQGAFTNAADWTDFQASDRRFEWGSIWTMFELRALETCVIASASYENSITHLVTEAVYGAKIEIRETVLPSSSKPDAVVEIVYFAEHRGSTHFWTQSPVGRDCIAKVRDFLSEQDVGYWATNVAIEPELKGHIKGERASPKSEGTNALRDHRSCAFIFSAKGQPADKIIQRVLQGTPSDEQIELAREAEDIRQFVFRGAIRMADFTGRYRIYLYEKHQAEVLRDYIEQQGFAVDLVPCVEAGLIGIEREKKRAPGTDERSQSEKKADRQKKDRERKERQRATDKAAKKANGTYVGPGCPKQRVDPEITGCPFVPRH